MQIKKLSHEKTKMNSRLEFEMSGSEIDYVVTNTIRRTILSEIPIMVFYEIDITENTSVFNNNQLRLYIRNIPVVGVKNVPLSYRKKKDKVDEAEEDEDLDDLIGGEVEIVEEKEEVESSSLENLTMYLEYVNDSSEIKSVTTEDAKFYYMGNEIKNPYPNPVILIKLQPKQKIKLSAKTRLSVEKEDGKHSHTAICAYNELDKNKFKFFLESRGQLEEKELLIRACEVINKKLRKMSKIFPEMKLKDGEIKIPKESHTVGNLISHGLYGLKECEYATYYQKHMLDNEVFIRFGFDKETEVKNKVEKVIKEYRELFEKIKKSFEKL